MYFRESIRIVWYFLMFFGCTILLAQKKKQEVSIAMITSWYRPGPINQYWNTTNFSQTVLFQLNYRTNKFEYGGFLGNGFPLPGEFHSGVNLNFYPKRIVFTLPHQKTFTIYPYARTEIYRVYRYYYQTFLGRTRVSTNLGPGIKVNLNDRLSIRYEYLFFSYNRNRIGVSIADPFRKKKQKSNAKKEW